MRIVAENITYTYNKDSAFSSDALKGITLTIEEGEFFGIIGHTGSGKSTFVQHLNALIKLPTAEKKYKPKKLKKGQTPPVLPKLKIGDYDLADKNCNFVELRSKVGMVFQYPEYQLFADTVKEDVAYGLTNFYKELSEEEKEKRVKDALTVVGLDYDEIKEKSPFELSGGQKRRVAIAGVIVTHPEILILDEPAAGLDPVGKKEIMALLHKLHENWCKTVIIVSHDMDEISENCTKTAVFYSGEVVACDTPANIFKDKVAIENYSLDIPVAAKLCRALEERGIVLESNYTCDDVVEKIKELFEKRRDGNE